MIPDWVRADRYGLAIPAHPEALKAGGAAFLSDAFRASGALGPDNHVSAITELRPVSGGSTGRKALLSVDYGKAAPELPRDLFVKFSRDFDDPVRDRGRSQMEFEVSFAELSGAHGLPIAVPRSPFGDYHRATGTGLLISERITFGSNGIERQYHKCLDDELPQPLEHYRALLTAVARLAGTHKAGGLPAGLVEQFPRDLRAAAVGERAPLTVRRLARRVERFVEFAVDCPGLLPDNVRSPGFTSRLADEVVAVARHEDAIWDHLAGDPDYLALCHWNANVDNAWFWRGGEQRLHCGLMDWGCVSQMNLAMAIWGCLSAARTDLWDNHFDELLEAFVTEVNGCGGPPVRADTVERHVMLYAAVMGVAWLLDVPALLYSRVPGLAEVRSPLDPRIRGDEGLRAPLQMLTNVMNLWQRHRFGDLVSQTLSPGS